MAQTDYQTIDEFIAAQPNDVQAVLEDIRQAVAEAAPDAKEAISYQMPTFKLSGKNLVHFASHTNHIGFYPTPSGINAFEKELAEYKPAKGSVKFPLESPMPFDLIKRITRYRAKEVKEG